MRANATSNLSLWPGFVGSVWAYRNDFPSDHRLTRAMAAVSLVGGVLGAVLLVNTPSTVFDRLIPWLLLFATVVFTFSSRLTSALAKYQRAHRPPLAVVLTGQFLLAIYGGYFGGGIGLMMLAAYAFLSLPSIHQMNALKSLLAGLINLVALVTFVLAKKIVWPAAAVMTVGALGGGYVAAKVAQRLPAAWVKRFVIATGWLLTGYFFFLA